MVREAVASSICQNPAELVIVNDGSTDEETLQCLADLEATGIHVIHQENRGLSGARMRGVQETIAPLIMALDADDHLAVGALEKMATTLLADPDLAVVWGDFEIFGEKPKRFYPRGRLLDPWRITYLNELVASTMVRRSSLLEAGGWVLRHGYEDWDLWMAMAERDMKGAHAKCVSLRYRFTSTGMFSSATKHHRALKSLLRQRHPDLFAQRRENRKKSKSNWLLKAIWTCVDLIPFPNLIDRYLMYGSLVVCEPSRWPRKKPPRYP